MWIDWTVTSFTLATLLFLLWNRRVSLISSYLIYMLEYIWWTLANTYHTWKWFSRQNADCCLMRMRIFDDGVHCTHATYSLFYSSRICFFEYFISRFYINNIKIFSSIILKYINKLDFQLNITPPPPLSACKLRTLIDFVKLASVSLI